MSDSIPEATEAETAKVLTFEDIASANDIDTEEVYIPQWKGKVIVKVFTKAESNDIRRQLALKNSGESVDPDEFERLVIMTGLVEPALSTEQYSLLLQRSTTAVQEIIAGILKVNGMGPEAQVEEEKSFPE